MAAHTAMHLTASSAWAQLPARLPGTDNSLLAWGIAAGLVVVVCITGFLDPKRSHRK
ncbi:MAG: hypothetical protein AABZ12_12800 [Planctomycetota bacterium]